MNGTVRRIVVACRKAPKVELGHLRILRSNPNHQRVHHCDVEDGEQHAGDVEADTEEQSTSGQRLDHCRRRFGTGEQNWA